MDKIRIVYANIIFLIVFTMLFSSYCAVYAAPPVFTNTADPLILSIAENSPIGTNVGTPLTATDADNDTIRYMLGGEDVSSFTINPNTGQLKTFRLIDYEVKTTYKIVVIAFDQSINDQSTAEQIMAAYAHKNVTINVTDVTGADDVQWTPPLPSGTVARSIAENSPLGTEVGAAVDITDARYYSLGGTDVNSFKLKRRVVNNVPTETTGQIVTNALLDYETKQSYAVTLIGYDNNDQVVGVVNVIINVTDVTGAADVQWSPPELPSTVIERSIAENSPRGTNVGNPVTIANANFYALGGTDVNSFSIVSGTGQIKTLAPLDYESKKKYTVKVVGYDDGADNLRYTADDISRGDQEVIINVTDVTGPTDEPIVVARRSTETFEIVAGTPYGDDRVALRSGTSVGAVSESGAMYYQLTGRDADKFRLVDDGQGSDYKTGYSRSGQLLVYNHLDVGSYSVTVNAYNSNLDHIAIIPVTIRIKAPGDDPPALRTLDAITRPAGGTSTYTLADGSTIQYEHKYQEGGWTSGDPVYTEHVKYARTYELSGADANSGVLRISTAPHQGPNYDYEGRIVKGTVPTKTQYRYTIEAYHADGTKIATRALTVKVELTNLLPDPTPPETKPRSTFTIDSNRGIGYDVGTVSVPSATGFQFKITSFRTETVTVNNVEKSFQVAVYEPDSDYFSINSNGELKVASNQLDKTRYSFTINAYRFATHIAIVPVTVIVTRPETIPRVTFTIDSNKGVGDRVGTVSAPDANSYRFKIVSYREVPTETGQDTDNDGQYDIVVPDGKTSEVAVYESDSDYFSLDGNTLKLASSSLDRTRYSFTINAYNNARHIAIMPVTVIVRQVPPPARRSANYTWTVAEDAAIGTQVGSFAKNQQAIIYTIAQGTQTATTQTKNVTIEEWAIGGADAGHFSIEVYRDSNNVSLGVRVKTSSLLDYETKNTYAIDILGWEDSLAAKKPDWGATVLIKVTDVAEPQIAEQPEPQGDSAPPVGKVKRPEPNSEQPPAAQPPPSDGTQPAVGGATEGSAPESPQTPQQQEGLNVQSVPDAQPAPQPEPEGQPQTIGGSEPESAQPAENDGTQPESSPQTPTNTVSLEVSDIKGLNIESPPDAQPAEPNVDQQYHLYFYQHAGKKYGRIVNESKPYSNYPAPDDHRCVWDPKKKQINLYNGGTLVKKVVLTAHTMDGTAMRNHLADWTDLAKVYDKHNVLQGVLSNTEREVPPYSTLYDPDDALKGGLSEDNKIKAIWRLYTKADATEKILYYVIARTTRAANEQMSWVHSGDSKTYSEQEAAAKLAFRNIENHAEWKLVLGTPSIESPFANPPGAPIAVAREDVKRGQMQAHFTDVVPKKTALLPNYPNPFNPETWIPYHLAKATEVTLHIYALDGTRVRTLSLGHQAAGIYKNKSRAAYWDGKNALGEPVSSGVYFYTLTAGDFTATRKLLILK